jgi:uncharacterized protein YndB with AHSA1/START domain
MGHRFELAQEGVVQASPEQVWDAIATGPGWDSWFMGRNEIEPRVGGTVSFSIGDFTATSTVKTYDPPRRFVSESEHAPVGELHSFDYALEEEGGGTRIKYVHSGMLGDDWEAEYEGMSEGDPMYFAKLLEYVTHFPGRFAAPIDAHGPNAWTRSVPRLSGRAGSAASSLRDRRHGPAHRRLGADRRRARAGPSQP